MTQPPYGSGGLPGHPEPEPVPIPEPDPPQPIPPPDPVPAPEPPHEDTRPTASAGGPADDFIDAEPPTEELPWPPVGAYPDETGHALPTEAPEPVAMSEQPTVWQQPPPTEPFHARHEKAGEWRYDPPEHLAFQHSPPAEMHDPTEHVGSPPPEQPWQMPLTPDEPDRRRRTGLWASLALTVTLLLCGGGAASAYLLLRDADAGGAPDPATAVNDFMTAVYARQDATSAEHLICREARDADKLAARVDQIKHYGTEYDSPTFRWTEPAVSGQDEERATVTVQLTMSTEDEKTAQQQLTFTTVRKTNWLVCDIS